LLGDVRGHDVADEIGRRGRGFFVFQIHNVQIQLVMEEMWSSSVRFAAFSKMRC
jgi:hypothetical protein